MKYFFSVHLWSRHKNIFDKNHPAPASCEKFQPFWDCFNELFIKPITLDQESQTSPTCGVLSTDHIQPLTAWEQDMDPKL